MNKIDSFPAEDGHIGKYSNQGLAGKDIISHMEQ